MLGQHGISLSKESAFNEPIFDRPQAPAPLETLRASAGRRNCRGPSLRGEDFLEKTLEARIASQWIENRIDFDFKGKPVAFFTGLCNPGEGLLLVTQPHVGSDVLNGWDVLAARGLFFDSLELFLCQCVNGSLKARLGISAFEQRGILSCSTEVQSFAPFGDSLLLHLLFFVGIAKQFMAET